MKSDYVEVTIPAGRTRAAFDVIIVEDNLFERSETFRVTINAASIPHGVVLGSLRSAVGIILDDDGNYDFVFKYFLVKCIINVYHMT